MRVRVTAVAAAVCLVALASCSEAAPEADTTEADTTGAGTATTVADTAVSTTAESSTPETSGAPATTESPQDPCVVGDRVECARASTIVDLVPDVATEASGEPIRLGMVNQENTAAGSFPELSIAARAAIDFLNAELGGINGRPIEFTVCNTEFSAEGSSACAQQFVEDGVVAVLGGIDIFGNAVEILDSNSIPYVGGIPVSTQSVTSPNSFQWSGGIWGATVAFAHHAVTEANASKVSILYGEFGSISAAAEYGETVLEASGVEVQMVPFPIVSTDISSALAAAASSNPDAIFILASDAGCKSGFDGLAALDIDVTAYFVGACAASSIIGQVDASKTNGLLFNVEGPVTAAANQNPDGLIFNAILAEYTDGLAPSGAGTVTFRATMNLLMVLDQIEGDITPAAIIEALRSQVDAPSFNGHPYTCDGNQFSGLPAMCSPQQIIVRMDDRTLTQVSDWIDVGAIYGG